MQAEKNRILSFEDIVILCFQMAAILKQILKMKSVNLNLCLKNIHNHTHLTDVPFVYYANNHFMEVFY